MLRHKLITNLNERMMVPTQMESAKTSPTTENGMGGVLSASHSNEIDS